MFQYVWANGITSCWKAGRLQNKVHQRQISALEPSTRLTQPRLSWCSRKMVPGYLPNFRLRTAVLHRIFGSHRLVTIIPWIGQTAEKKQWCKISLMVWKNKIHCCRNPITLHLPNARIGPVSFYHVIPTENNYYSTWHAQLNSHGETWQDRYIRKEVHVIFKSAGCPNISNDPYKTFVFPIAVFVFIKATSQKYHNILCDWRKCNKMLTVRINFFVHCSEKRHLYLLVELDRASERLANFIIFKIFSFIRSNRILSSRPECLFSRSAVSLN